MTRYADPGHRYRLDSRIATGGMGEVWRGTDQTLGRPVAIKLLKHEYADDPSFRTRFESEARNAAALHHPNVAAVFDFGDSEEHRPYLVMELVDGQPLSALLRPGRQMPAEQATGLLVQAADALGAAHKVGIVHRDVKPANLLVTPDRTMKITDFGIARAADGMALTQTGQVMGTPQYLSPEQAEGKSATSASDVYSLGVVLFECLAGRRPFQGETPVATALAHIREPVPELPGNVPADLANVVRRCLAKDPRDRFKDASALAVALRSPSSVKPVVVPPLDPTATLAPTAVLSSPVLGGTVLGSPVPPPRRRISPWWLLIPLLALLALVAWAFWQGLSDDGTPSGGNHKTSQSVTTRTTHSTTPTEDETVKLNGAAVCDGRPVDQVQAALVDLELDPVLSEQTNPGTETEGEVISCNPTGDLAKGTQVTVEYWGPVATPTETPTDTTTPSVTDSTTITLTTGPGNGNGNSKPKN